MGIRNWLLKRHHSEEEKEQGDVWLIVGLGNPGKKYEHTRHNAGFDVLDVLYERLNNPAAEKFSKSSARRGLLEGERVLLCKPLTYMNLSGEAVREAAAYYKIDPATRIVVICDDVDLPVGQLRLRKKGSAGSHNGLKSIIGQLGTESFLRLRVGVGERADKREDLVDHVLGHFHGEEKVAMEQAMERAADAVCCLLREGPEAAMTRFNMRLSDTEKADPS